MGIFSMKNFNFLLKTFFHKFVSMINHASQGGIYWTIQTCLTNLKFSEHLLFANLNDFSLKSTDFIKDSQMQVVYFCNFFFYKNQFSQKNVLCLIKLPGGNFWTI